MFTKHGLALRLRQPKYLFGGVENDASSGSGGVFL